MVKCYDYVLITCVAQLQERAINWYKCLSHARTHCGTIIGKEYVCVLRLHSAIESETQLAKVTLNVLTDFKQTIVVHPFFSCIFHVDFGSDGWCTIPAPSSHISRQETTAS